MPGTQQCCHQNWGFQCLLICIFHFSLWVVKGHTQREQDTGEDELQTGGQEAQGFAPILPGELCDPEQVTWVLRAFETAWNE